MHDFFFFFFFFSSREKKPFLERSRKKRLQHHPRCFSLLSSRETLSSSLRGPRVVFLNKFKGEIFFLCVIRIVIVRTKQNNKKCDKNVMPNTRLIKKRCFFFARHLFFSFFFQKMSRLRVECDGDGKRQR